MSGVVRETSAGVQRPAAAARFEFHARTAEPERDLPHPKP